MKCPNCNAEVIGKFCEYCGSELPKEKNVTNINNNSKTIINNYYSGTNMAEKQTRKTKNNPPNPSKKSNYKFEGIGVTILWLLFFFPVGIIRMWSRKEFPKTVRIIITAFFGILIIGALVSPDTNPKTETNTIHESIAFPSASPSPSPTPTPKEFDSLEDAFKKGFEDGLGNSYEERKDEIKEDVDSIKESIDYIFSE